MYKRKFWVVAQRAPRVLAALAFVFSLSGCVTVNMAGTDTLQDMSRAQKQMREHAAALSKTAWKTVASRSFFDSISGMLINGRDEPEGPGLVPDPRGRSSTAVAYIEETGREFASPAAQLDAIAADVRQKTLEAKAMVASTQIVLNTYQESQTAEPQQMASASSATIVQGLANIQADRRIVEQSIASARKQQATFQIAERAYVEKYPAADTTVISKEIESFGRQIDLMIALSLELNDVAVLS